MEYKRSKTHECYVSSLSRSGLRTYIKSEVKTVTPHRLKHLEVKCHDVSSITNYLNLHQRWPHEYESTSFLLQPKTISQMNFFFCLFTWSDAVFWPNGVFGRLCNSSMEKSRVHPTAQHQGLRRDLPFLQQLQCDRSIIWSLTRSGASNHKDNI